jgi:anti-sigma B factor antagonist
VKHAELTHFSLDEQSLPAGRIVLTARGAIDLFAAPELKRRLLEAVNLGAREIVLDLTRAEFLDSTSLGALLTAHKRLHGRGGALVIVAGPTGASPVFEVTGLDGIFAFAATREQALAELDGNRAARPPTRGR